MHENYMNILKSLVLRAIGEWVGFKLYLLFSLEQKNEIIIYQQLIVNPG